MKNKLIAAFLTFTAISLTAQQPSGAELLAHLKSVKADIQNHLSDMTADNESIFVVNLVNELHEKSESLQQYTSNAVNQVFDSICNNMTTWTELFYLPMDQEKQIIITDEKELYKLFESIYTKLHKSYCNDNPNGAVAKITAHDMFQPDLIVFLDGFIIPNALAKKIDAKIKELEA